MCVGVHVHIAGGDDYTFTNDDMVALKSRGFYCFKGHTDGTGGTVAALPLGMKVPSDTVGTLDQFVKLSALYTLGIVLAFIAQVMRLLRVVRVCVCVVSEW